MRPGIPRVVDIRQLTDVYTCKLQQHLSCKRHLHEEQSVFVQALSAATSFAACLRLFRRYPLAVTPPAVGGGHPSMVLLNRAGGVAAFYLLTWVRDDLFVIRSWDGRDGLSQAIRPEEPVSGVTSQVISHGMPLPHDGALLGWLTDSQVTVMLAVHCPPPGASRAPGAPVPFPEIRVMPMAGTSCLPQWPPFTASPLDDGRLWEYVEWGQIVDIGPLVTRTTGFAFWVPCPGTRRLRGEGFVVIRDNLPGDDYWLPAGVYMDHWTLREGIQAPPAGHLLSLPGVVDLAYQLR
jgi:hypothetical protein